MRLFAEGQSVKEIALVLNLSEKTVEFHKHHIMEAFNLKSNADSGPVCAEKGINLHKPRTLSRSSRPRDFPSSAEPHNALGMSCELWTYLDACAAMARPSTLTEANFDPTTSTAGG